MLPCADVRCSDPSIIGTIGLGITLGTSKKRPRIQAPVLTLLRTGDRGQP